MKNTIIKIFTETPIWNDDRETSTPADYEWEIEDRKERESDLEHYKFLNTQENGDYTYSTYINEDTVIVAVRLKGKNIPLIGELVLDRSDKYPFPNVVSAHVLKPFRGKGIAKDIYKIIIDRFNGIVSDKSLSGADGKGSFNIWQNLAKTYIPYIASRSKMKTQLTKVNGFDPKEVMNDPNTRLVISKKPLK